jgi:Leucine-rich repeat (LRR) protein
MKTLKQGASGNHRRNRRKTKTAGCTCRACRYLSFIAKKMRKRITLVAMNAIEKTLIAVNNSRINWANCIINATLFVMPAEKRFYTINEINEDNFSSVKIVSDFGYHQTHLPPLIFKMSNLKRLKVYIGEIIEIPDDISYLINLQELYLQSNKIERVSKKIAQLSKLKKLRLNGNKISDITSICSIPNLMELEIGRNEIKSIPNEIGNLKKLRKLDLGNIFFSNEIENVSNQIGLLENLEMLSIHGARLMMLNEPLGELVKLRDLSIRNSQVKEIRFVFDKLQNLEVLDFTNNNISSLSSNLSKAVNLKSIYLDNNPIKEFPESILNLPKLKIIGISGTQIDLDSTEWYKRKYPKIKFLTANSYFAETFNRNNA